MNNSIIYLLKSQKPDKKFKVLVGPFGHASRVKTIHFGSKGMSDYTLNKDPQRKHLYIKRHRARENWNRSGIKTAGFWSRWLLWNKPTLDESIKDIEKRFHVIIQQS
jgi:hypothetical protein